MKKIIVIICLIVLAGCGVKSDLVRNEGYPRDYPVY